MWVLFIIINAGKLIADGTPESIAASLSSDHSLVARIEGKQEQVLPVLKGLGQDVQVDVAGPREENGAPDIYEYHIQSSEQRDLRRPLFRALCQNNMPLLLLKTSELTLEEVFLQLINEQKSLVEEGKPEESRQTPVPEGAGAAGSGDQDPEAAGETAAAGEDHGAEIPAENGGEEAVSEKEGE